jgi:DnaJ-class molecular chaperone
MGFDRVMPTNHYDVLGVSREAGPDEIKHAYRKLSLNWHPDRNKSPEAQSKSQEINAAYEALSDERRRQEYNAELDGVRTQGHMQGGQEVDLNDIINMMFQGGGMPFGMHGGMHFGPGGPEIRVFHGGMPHPFHHPGNLFRQMQKPPPIVKQLEIEFDQAYSGCTLCINVDKWCVKNDVKIHETEPIYVSVPPGIDNDEVIVMQNCGNTVSAELKGDIHFAIKVKPSEMFERHGMDLLYKRAISLKESLTGFSFEISHVNGKVLCLNNTKNRTIITPNYRKVIPNLGMVRDGNTGNLIIEFSVVFPESLTEEQTKQLAEIL